MCRLRPALTSSTKTGCFDSAWAWLMMLQLPRQEDLCSSPRPFADCATPRTPRTPSPCSASEGSSFPCCFPLPLTSARIRLSVVGIRYSPSPAGCRSPGIECDDRRHSIRSSWFECVGRLPAAASASTPLSTPEFPPVEGLDESSPEPTIGRTSTDDSEGSGISRRVDWGSSRSWTRTAAHSCGNSTEGNPSGD